VIRNCVVTDSEEKIVSSKFVLVRDAMRARCGILRFQHTLSNAVVTVALLAPHPLRLVVHRLHHPLRLVIFDWLQSSFRVSIMYRCDLAGKNKVSTGTL